MLGAFLQTLDISISHLALPLMQRSFGTAFGNDRGIQTSELVRDQVVIGHTPLIARVLRVRPRVQRPHRNDKPETVGGGHLATAPGFHERYIILRRDQALRIKF